MKTKKQEMEIRAKNAADYVILKKCTVRECAKYIKTSKSTVHKDLTERLVYIDRRRYDQVQEIILINKKERNIRGGESTKRLYLNLHNCKQIAS